MLFEWVRSAHFMLGRNILILGSRFENLPVLKRYVAWVCGVGVVQYENAICIIAIIYEVILTVNHNNLYNMRDKKGFQVIT